MTFSVGMILTSTWLLCCLIVGMPCTRSLAPVEWQNLGTASKTLITTLPGVLPLEGADCGILLLQERLSFIRDAKLAHLQETNLTTSLTSHRRDSDHEHHHSTSHGTQKLAMEHSWSLDKMMPRQLHLISIHSQSKRQRLDQTKHKLPMDWLDYSPIVSMVLLALVAPLLVGICILLVLRMREPRAENDSSKAPAHQLLSAQGRNSTVPGSPYFPSLSPAPSAANFPSHSPGSFGNVMALLGTGGNWNVGQETLGGHSSRSPGVRSPSATRVTVPNNSPSAVSIQFPSAVPSQIPTVALQPNQVSQVFIIEGSIAPKAQTKIAVKIKNPAGEVVAKASVDEGGPGEAEIEGHHGILLDIPPRKHVAFLDTSEIHANQNPVVTVFPWHDPIPDLLGESLAIVHTDEQGGFQVYQGDQITLCVPMNQRNGTVTGVFEHTGTGELGHCVAAFASKLTGSGSSSTSVSVTHGADTTLMVSVLLCVLKLGGRVAREGALGSAADKVQNMFEKLTGH